MTENLRFSKAYGPGCPQSPALKVSRCHLCRGPSRCHLRVGLCSDTCQASGCHSPGPARGLAAPSSLCPRAGPHLHLSHHPHWHFSPLGSTEERQVHALVVSASFSRSLDLLLGSRGRGRDEKNNHALCPDGLQSFVHDAAYHLWFIM